MSCIHADRSTGGRVVEAVDTSSTKPLFSQVEEVEGRGGGGGGGGRSVHYYCSTRVMGTP